MYIIWKPVGLWRLRIQEYWGDIFGFGHGEAMINDYMSWSSSTSWMPLWFVAPSFNLLIKHGHSNPETCETANELPYDLAFGSSVSKYALSLLICIVPFSFEHKFVLNLSFVCPCFSKMYVYVSTFTLELEMRSLDYCIAFKRSLIRYE